MRNAKQLRRTAIAAGAAVLLVAALWRIGGSAFADIGSRLAPGNDPALLRLGTLAAAAQGDAATIRVIARFAATSVETDDRQAIRAIGETAIAFTDQLEPAARSVGLTIVAPSPAPTWLIPCFRDVQATVQAAGTTLVEWSTAPRTGETPAVVEAAVRGLADLADLTGIAVSTGTAQASAPPAATDPSHIGAQLTDPQFACEEIRKLGAALAP